MKSKLISVLLSVAMAFGLWYYVITVISPDTTDTFYDIPVVLVGETALEERGLMVTSVSNTTVDLTLTGNRSDLNQLTRENITLKAYRGSAGPPAEGRSGCASGCADCGGMRRRHYGGAPEKLTGRT